MGLLQVVTLVLGFCLVFTKAESETASNTVKDDETFPIKDKLDSATVTEHWFSDVKEKLDPNETAEDDPKKLAVKEESKEARRTIRPWRRPAPIRLPIVVPNLRVARNFFAVSYRFCFRRRTKVPGLRQQFLGWKLPYQSGYVVIKNWIYYFYRCNPKSQPATAKAKTTAPPTTFST